MTDEKKKELDAEHKMEREQMNETGYTITAAPVSSDDASFLDDLDGLPPIAPPGQ